MAAKLLHSLADDNPDLQKQIGCMNGIFHIFERQHMGRRLTGHAHKRLLPPGHSQFDTVGHEADSIPYNRETMERAANKYVNDKRVSTESSRASFSSSSRSSSFSSLDCGRISHPAPSSTDRMIFPETPSRDPVISQPSASPKLGRLSLDLRDVVKESMYRESRGLSVQTTIKEDRPGLSSRQRDSPRPLQLSNSVNGSLGANGKSDLPANLKESLKVLAKLREAPWLYNEKGHGRLPHETKDGPSFSVSRDAPRYSYDGRERANRLSFESRDFSKPNQRIRDLPRLSLDSRESSLRSSGRDSHKNAASLSRNFQGRNDKCGERDPKTEQTSRPSSVVAKLMGLDAFPEPKATHDDHMELSALPHLGDHGRSSVHSKIKSDVCRPMRLPSSPRSSRKEPTSPRWKNADMKPVSSSKFPIEPAPWKHHESGQASRKQAPTPVKTPENKSKSSPSVYSEIEKRLKDLEFKQSGKDLRALKQILEAMQAKGLLGTPKEEPSSNVVSKRENEQSFMGSNLNSGLMSPYEAPQDCVNDSTLKGNTTSPSKDFESPIVIMKPAKLIQKSGVPPLSIIPIDSLPGLRSSHSNELSSHSKYSVNRRTARDQVLKDARRDQASSSSDKKTNNKTLRGPQSSTRSQQSMKDNNATTSSFKNSGSTSPRLQSKKLEFDRRSRPPTPPDNGKSRKQPVKQSISTGGSPGGRRRPKAINMAQNDDQFSEISSHSRNLSFQGDDISVQSDPVVVSELTGDVEVVSSNELSLEVSAQIPSPEFLKYAGGHEMKVVPSSRSKADLLVKALPAVAPEHPSPVSVLDAFVDREESPSPVNQTPPDLEGNAIKISEVSVRGQWNSAEVDLSPRNGTSGATSEINRQKLQNIENLVQKLRRLNSSHDEARTDYIASLCENSNPDHRYISEILLASGLLLRDLSSGLATIQLHPSGHPINPELFFVLEQTKASSTLSKLDCCLDKAAQSKLNQEKFRRKLIFDAVNEILVGKCALVGRIHDPWSRANKLTQKTLNAQKLLKELCSEIEGLHGYKKKQDFFLEEEEDGMKSIFWEDVMKRSESWTDFYGDVSGIVLDVERSIFKDLVDEVVTGEAFGLRGKPSRRCRQLF